jgi:folate-binding protein YgfZ
MTTDLERALRARGAVLDTFQGLTLPANFGDVGREWRAAREGAAVYAAGFRTFIAATGDDRVSFLQGMLTNDVKALAVGQGVYAAFLTVQGKVVSDLRVYALPDRLLLDVVKWRRAPFEAALEKFIVADDIELAASEQQPLLGLEGPLARTLAGQALGLTDLPRTPYAHVRASFEGEPLLVIAASELERDGLLLCGPPTSAPPLFAALLEAGAQPLGMQGLDILRVEAGVPWPGIDMDESTLMMETGREAALSFTKGCYLGQETVERIAARGHVNRLLTGVVLDGDVLPPRGAKLFADEREVGHVTSPVRSEALGRVIGLAMVQRKHATPGERLAVETGGASTTAIVSPPPFEADSSD